jgi:hypothetical protein
VRNCLSEEHQVEGVFVCPLPGRLESIGTGGIKREGVKVVDRFSDRVETFELSEASF